jgi:hypothetical protein
MRLAVADGLKLGRTQRINLAPALIAVLGQHAAGQAQLAGEYALQNVVVCDAPHRVTLVKRKLFTCISRQEIFLLLFRGPLRPDACVSC